MEYKAEITLNEEDSLQDMLNTEKAIVKLYATAITEGCSKEYRTIVKSNLIEELNDQINVFFDMTECDYVRVKAQDREKLKELKEKFTKIKSQLS